MGPNNLLRALPIVGTLTRTANGYEVTDARVVYPTGEGKQWTPDGKGVVILGGQFDAGNVDDIEVDLATGEVYRVTVNLDYDEDMDFSPNEAMDRDNFLPVYVGAPVYDEYALPIKASNQEWVIALEDELKRENGIPLFDTGDGYTARSMPSCNPPATRARAACHRFVPAHAQGYRMNTARELIAGAASNTSAGKTWSASSPQSAASICGG